MVELLADAVRQLFGILATLALAMLLPLASLPALWFLPSSARLVFSPIRPPYCSVGLVKLLYKQQSSSPNHDTKEMIQAALRKLAEIDLL